MTADKWQFFNAEQKYCNNDELNSSFNVTKNHLSQRENNNKNSSSSFNKRHKKSSSTSSSICSNDLLMRLALNIEISFTPTNQYNTFEVNFIT